MCARSDFTRSAAKQFDSQCVVEEHRKMKCSRKIFFNNLLINICKITHAAAAASGRCVSYTNKDRAVKKRALTYLVLEPSDKVDIFCVCLALCGSHTAAGLQCCLFVRESI